MITKTDFDNKLLFWSYFPGKSFFEEDGTQNWLVFQPIQRYFKAIIAGNRNASSWKSKGFSDEIIKPPKPNKILNPSLDYIGTKTRVKINGDCLKQEKITYTHGKIVNIFTVSEIEKSINISS